MDKFVINRINCAFFINIFMLCLLLDFFHGELFSYNKVCSNEADYSLLQKIWNGSEFIKYEKAEAKRLRPFWHDGIGKSALFPIHKSSGQRPLMVVPDLHGTLEGLLWPLSLSEIANWDFLAPWVLFDTKKHKVVSCSKLSDLSDNRLKDIVPILNLHLNITENGGGDGKESKAKTALVLLGDYFDRGRYSLELFYSLFYLLQQQQYFHEQERALGKQHERRLISLLGNHEIDILLNPEKGSIKPCLLSSLSEDVLQMRQRVQKSLQKGLEKKIFKIIHHEAGAYFSHSFISEEFLDEIEVPIKSLHRLTHLARNATKVKGDKKILKKFIMSRGPLWARLEHLSPEEKTKKNWATPITGVNMIVGHTVVRQSGINDPLYPQLFFLDTGIYSHGPTFGLWQGDSLKSFKFQKEIKNMSYNEKYKQVTRRVLGNVSKILEFIGTSSFDSLNLSSS